MSESSTIWTVCIKAGKFDIPLYESEIKQVAKRYQKHLKPHASAPVKLKHSSEVRLLKETFSSEDIIIAIST